MSQVPDKILKYLEVHQTATYAQLLASGVCSRTLLAICLKQMRCSVNKQVYTLRWQGRGERVYAAGNLPCAVRATSQTRRAKLLAMQRAAKKAEEERLATIREDNRHFWSCRPSVFLPPIQVPANNAPSI